MLTGTEVAVERIHPPRWLISYLVNPVARPVLRKKRKMGEQVLLLRFSGRRTGRSYELPVGYRRIDGRLALISDSGWRLNFQGGRDVEITLKGEIVVARASLMADPSEVAQIYEGLIDEVGLFNAARQLGIKLHVDRKPTRDELTDMVRLSGLSVIWLDTLS